MFGIKTTSFAVLLAGAGLAIGTAWGGLLTHFAAGVFLQAGYCPIDLSSSCVTLPAWTAPASQTPGQFHPAIKFGLSDPANHQGTWKVTFQQVVSGGQVVIAEA